VILGIKAGQALVYPSHMVNCCTLSANSNLKIQQIALTTSDGYRLHGWYIPSRNEAAILLLHGRGGNRTDLLPYAEFLAERGYGLLLLDSRAHGESSGEKFSYAVWHDVEAAADFLTQQPDVKHIGVFGASQGGVAAVIGAARVPEISAIAADGLGVVGWDDYPARTALVDWLYVPYDAATYLSYKWASESHDLWSLKESVKRITPRPLLLITAGAVDGASEFERRVNYGVYETAGAAKDMWVVPNTGHCGGLAVYPDEYKSRLLAFFGQHLLS
jgi:uncharacterized protein